MKVSAHALIYLSLLLGLTLGTQAGSPQPSLPLAPAAPPCFPSGPLPLRLQPSLPPRGHSGLLPRLCPGLPASPSTRPPFSSPTPALRLPAVLQEGEFRGASFPLLPPEAGAQRGKVSATRGCRSRLTWP